MDPKGVQVRWGILGPAPGVLPRATHEALPGPAGAPVHDTWGPGPPRVLSWDF